MVGRRRKDMMIVVPTFSERRNRQDPVVRRLVIREKRSLPEDVADGVDTPRDVVANEHPYQATPEQTGQRAMPTAEQTPDSEGECETDQGPSHERPVNEDDDRVADEILGPAVAVGDTLVVEHPSDVSVNEAANLTRDSGCKSGVR